MFARTALDLGLIVRERRRNLGMDQSDLAARAGVSRQWIIDIEKGKPRAEVGLVLRTLTELGLKVRVESEIPEGQFEGNGAGAGSGAGNGDGTGYGVGSWDFNIDDVIERARGKKK
ncbi:MAG: helix-turn-helix transcriptional regulator [Alphaproteobacteria bacterium]|nr:helix-turn-helix transcriptional regulator [Alphaproteobacteria bacterium]